MIEIIDKLDVFGLPMLVLLAYFGYKYRTLVHPINSAFPRRIESLQEKNYPGTYHRYLSNFLRWVEKLVGEYESPTSGTLRSYCVSALTGRSHDFLLLLAVLYPILFLVIGWVSGNTGVLGTVQLLEPTAGTKRAAAIFCVFAAFFIGLLLALFIYGLAGICIGAKSALVNTVTGFIVVIVLPLATYKTISSGIGYIGASANAFPATLGVALGLGIGIGYLIALSDGYGSAKEKSVNSGFALLLVGTSVGAGAGLTFEILGSNGLGAVAGGAIGFTVLSLSLQAIQSSANRFAFILLYCALCITVLIIFADASSEIMRQAVTIILLVCFLPLLNSPIDWLSFGITRGLLHHISDNRGKKLQLCFLAIVDVIAAIFFLLAVAATTTFGIWLLNIISSLVGGEVLVELKSLLEQLRTGNWREKLWIWLTLGTTLVPTVIHFIVAVLALGFLKDHEKAEQMATLLRADRKRAENATSLQDAAVITSDMDARLFAFIHIYVYPFILAAFSLVIVLCVAVFFLNFLPGWIEVVLGILDPSIITVFENVG